MNNKLNLSGLWPDFFNLGFETSDQLASLFVVILLAVFFLFFIMSLFSYMRAKSRISWLSKHLDSGTTEDITNLRDKAKEKKDIVGHLWLEFDETLIEITKVEKTEFRNIIDSSHFFNPSTLAKGIADNRMIAAVPGFLTALGVVGTFIGLQLGLSGLDIGSGVSTNEMKNGISNVILGATIAFMTSVWGVFLSVLFNFFEKCLESDIRKRISKLQDQIDRIFPRLNAEEQLQSIVASTSQSRESLQGLAEKIGEKMQETMLTATQGISEALTSTLNDIMAPAISKLVDETSDGNQKALENLIEKFMDKFGEQGEQQRIALDLTSSKMNDSIQKMSDGMNEFVNKMKASQDAVGEREKELVSQISLQVSDLVTQGNEQKTMLNEMLDTQVTKMSKQLENISQSAKQTDQARNSHFIEQTNAMKNATDGLLDNVASSIAQQQNVSEQVLEQGRQLQQSIDSSINASTQASANMKQAAEKLEQASNNFGTSSQQIREAGNNLAESVTNTVDSLKLMSVENKSSAQHIKELHEKVTSNIESFNELAKRIESMFESSNSTFDELKETQTIFLDKQRENVESISKKMAELLTDYSEQANGQTARHLTVWSESTTSYATQMQNAVKAISSIVDEIQDKTSN